MQNNRLGYPRQTRVSSGIATSDYFISRPRSIPEAASKKKQYQIVGAGRKPKSFDKKNECGLSASFA
jgi:hypothetical protein